MWTVVMMRSSKSIAFAWRSRRWYAVYASASTCSWCGLASPTRPAYVSSSTSSFLRLETWWLKDLGL